MIFLLKKKNGVVKNIVHSAVGCYMYTKKDYKQVKTVKYINDLVVDINRIEQVFQDVSIEDFT